MVLKHTLSTYRKIRHACASFLTSNIYWQKVFESLFDVSVSVGVNVGTLAITKALSSDSPIKTVLHLIGISAAVLFFPAFIRMVISYHRALKAFDQRMKELSQ